MQVVRALSVGVWLRGQARLVYKFVGGSSKLSAWLGGGFKRCVALCTNRALVASARLHGKYLKHSPIGRLVLHG